MTTKAGTRREKRAAGLIFTANTTQVTTWIGCPRIEGEIARIEMGRDFVAKILRDQRKERRAK